ncbi:cupredoxin domain-containing protein [Patescibacteria group bacterium]|nr:cupredoxin domain-containing protein [Patescibacteria group bacterium]MCL5114893.1 cupredoxin domain-containing protein [Patescibacteria group bacterium]
MSKGNKKVTSGLLGGLILVIALVLIYLLVPQKSSAPSANTTSTNTNVPTSTPASSSAPSANATSSVPPVSATSSYQLTMPDGMLPLHPTGDAKLKIFGVSITKDGFNPSLIVVNQGDGVALSVKSVDGTYDIFFPALGSGTGQIEEGQSTFVSLVPPKAGEYVFECRTYCPYGNRITGKLVVLPR